MMLWTVALVLAASPQARLDRSIAEWCASRSQGAVAACTADQQAGLRRFQREARRLPDPRRQLANDCLQQSAVRPSLDWAAAGRCMSEAYLARVDRWRDPEHALAPTALSDNRWVAVTPGVR